MDAQTIALIQTDPDVTPDILAKIIDPLMSLLTETVDADYQAERVLQLLRLERADAFDRGIQNIAPSMDADGIVRFTNLGVQSGSLGETGDGSRWKDYNPRKTRSYRDKFVAILGQRPFYNCAAEPNDPTSEIDRMGARQVNLLVQKLRTEWDVRTMNNQLFFYLFKHGTVLGQVRPKSDAKKYGTHSVPNMVNALQCVGCGNTTTDPSAVSGPAPPCPNCGAPRVISPIQQGAVDYPNVSIEANLLNGYYWTCPFNAESVKRDGGTPWLGIESEQNKGQLLVAYPNARKIVGSLSGGAFNGSATEATGAMVRAAAQSQMGVVRALRNNLWGWRQNYLDPAEFELMTDDAARQIIKQVYPNGVRVVRIEDKPVAIRRASIPDEFSQCKPGMSDYLFCEGVSWGLFGLDDAWSNLLNIAADTLEACIARYILNPDFFNADAMESLRYSPERFIEALPKTGEGFSNAFAILPTSDFPEQMPEMMQVIDTVIQEITGLLPQLWGQMPQGLTLGQARMMLNQGLMQLSTVGDNATHFYESLFTNAVNMYLTVATVNPQFQGEQIDLDLIRRSSWTINGGTSMPRSFGERQAELMEMITQNPQLVEALQIMDPVNFDKLTALLDLPDLKNPKLEMMEAINDIIDQLWQQPPTPAPPGPPDPMTGQPGPPQGPPQPSIPFDSDVFDANIAVSLARYALASRNGQQRQGTPGYQNIKAFLSQALQTRSQMQQQQPQPPRLSLTMALDKMPTEQETAVLSKFGVEIPPSSSPSIDTISKVTQKEQTHQHDIESKHVDAQLNAPPLLQMPGQQPLPNAMPAPIQ